MHLALRMPVAMLVLGAFGCAPSSPSRPTAATTSDYSATLARDPWSLLRAGGGAAAVAPGVKAAAVIDGFRVHPDPDDDGVIRVVEGENVVVNASDIASHPPAPPTFLVVNWGDGPNQRVGCGPCRMDHSYEPGRYTLVASADNLPGDRSITLTVEVRPGRRPREPRFPYFGFEPERLPVGGTGRILFPLPFLELPGVTLSFPQLFCEPTFDIIQPNGIGEFIPPGYIALPFITTGAGSCTLTVSGEDANGPFTETSTLTIIP